MEVCHCLFFSIFGWQKQNKKSFQPYYPSNQWPQNHLTISHCIKFYTNVNNLFTPQTSAHTHKGFKAQCKVNQMSPCLSLIMYNTSICKSYLQVTIVLTLWSWRTYVFMYTFSVFWAYFANSLFCRVMKKKPGCFWSKVNHMARHNSYLK